jgi:hypothetical protein
MACANRKGKQAMAQTDELPTSIYSILRDPAFQAGVEDARTGRPARFDNHLGYEYERGPAFAFLVPTTMPFRGKGRKKINWAAAELLFDAFNNGDII